MSKGALNFSNDNEYYTPKHIVQMFGKFDYDPSTTEGKAKDLCIENYDTIDTDGLKRDWTMFKRIWINPPFTIKKLFLQKAVDTYMKAKNEIYFLSPIEFVTTKVFHEEVLKAGGVKLYIPNSRIRFESGLGKDSRSPAFGSVIFKIQDKSEIELINIDFQKKPLNQIELFND